jgi:prevent-host-death family protein
MKTVGIAELKARLSEHLRGVRGGRPLTILDRDTPIARLVPYEASEPLRVRRATRRPSEVALPPPPAGPTDSTALLLEDREKR